MLEVENLEATAVGIKIYSLVRRTETEFGEKVFFVCLEQCSYQRVPSFLKLIIHAVHACGKDSPVEYYIGFNSCICLLFSPMTLFCMVVVFYL